MPRVYLPLAAFLCTAAAIGPPVFPWGSVAAAMLPALLLLLQFRLLDDLADRHIDAVEHPDRVLPASDSITKFAWLVVIAATVNSAIVVVFGTLLHLAVLVALNLVLLAWYGWLRAYLRHPLLHSHVVLLKYPAFVFVLSGIIAAGSPAHPVYSMLVTYCALCIYEILHDPAMQRFRWSVALLVGETAILVVVAVLQISMLNIRSGT